MRGHTTQAFIVRLLLQHAPALTEPREYGLIRPFINRRAASAMPNPAMRPSTLHLPQGRWATVLDCLCDACAEHFDAVKRLLQETGVSYTVNPRLVRGLDYYTRTAWEFIVPGYSTVAGGGRYNGLVAEVGGPETPGVGFAGGLERALLVLQEQGI
ncbi:MAG: ATP phosphoribosyltransferase regulatory subunit, partial [Firmicutes bacterium]|nr:ATP phosphoribosyltransferase regulatory subunit [Bacillota bacterium]